jgi:hypothetical protein
LGMIASGSGVIPTIRLPFKSTERLQVDDLPLAPRLGEHSREVAAARESRPARTN